MLVTQPSKSTRTISIVQRTVIHIHIYLYFVLSNMLDDIRVINDDIQECKAMMKQKIEQDNIKAEIPNDEFLGI